MRIRLGMGFPQITLDRLVHRSQGIACDRIRSGEASQSVEGLDGRVNPLGQPLTQSGSLLAPTATPGRGRVVGRESRQWPYATV